MDTDATLLGRRAELAALAGLIGAHRLVTITGVGGVGKTRLALAAARGTSPAAVCLLARRGRADQVPAAVAESLGYPSWETALVGLGDRSALLVLDNCEHLLDAAADVVEQLLADAPRLSVLATSREPLALAGEHVLRLDPLALAAGPDVSDAAASPAVQLFLARAAAAGSPVALDVDTAPTLVELCRRLDGLPLAIELAAARARTLTPAEILGHLDRRLDLFVGHRRAPARHRSLEAMVDWSYERLDPGTRRFFDRLGVSEGLFTAEAAHAVGAEPGEDLVAVIGHLDQLVAQSLVQVHRRGDRSWYGMLETLRAYARARLIDSGEYDAVTNRCVDWAVTHCLEIRERSQRSWPAELTGTAIALRLDVHSALGYALDHDEGPDRAFPLYGLLWHADVRNGRARPVAELGERLLARWPDPAVPGWSEVAAVAATAHVILGSHRRGVELGRLALTASQSPLEAVMAQEALVLASLATGLGESCVPLVEAAITHAREHDLLPWRIELDSIRAIALADLGRVDEALVAAGVAHEEAATADSPVLAAWCALAHGHLIALRDPAAARPVLEEVVARSADAPLDYGLGYRALGALAVLTGDHRQAATGLHKAVDVYVRLGEAHVRTTLRWVAALAQRVGREDDAAALSATAGAQTAGELCDLLARATLNRRLGELPASRPALPLRDGIALARGVLAAIAEPVSEPGAEPAAAALSPDAAVFCREGAVWTLTFEGTTVRLPDAKGLHDLAVLLAKPGGEVHCSQLMGAAVEQTDTGPVLDAAARRSYEQRIVALQTELVEAEDAHDQGGADKARLEMDWLVDQLMAATGHGGRSRRTGATQERARSAVGWRIRSAIKSVAEVHPALGSHLRDAVRTGTWCSYQPQAPVPWRL